MSTFDYSGLDVSADSVHKIFQHMTSLSGDEAKLFWNEFLTKSSDDETLKGVKNLLSESDEFSDYLVNLFISTQAAPTQA